MKENFDFFLLIFTSLLTMMNPFAVMPVFVGFTEARGSDKARRLAFKATLTAFTAMILFTLTGQMIFRFFDVSIDALRIVGGVLFFVMGYDMLQGKMARTKTTDDEDGEEHEYSEDEAITPIGIPLLCGPGTITAVILFNKQAIHMEQKIALYLAITAISIVVFLCLAGAERFIKLLGESGNKVMFRIMGLIIMVIAVEFFFTGVRALLNLA